MEYSEEQQEHLNKLVAEARREGREQGIKKAENQLKELKEQLEAAESRKKALKESQEAKEDILNSILESRAAELGKAAKTAVEALPEKLTVMEKLEWLNENSEFFKKIPGTPKPEPPRSTPNEKRRKVTL